MTLFEKLVITIAVLGLMLMVGIKIVKAEIIPESQNDIANAINNGIIIGDEDGYRLTDPTLRYESIYIVGNYDRKIVQPALSALDQKIQGLLSGDNHPEDLTPRITTLETDVQALKNYADYQAVESDKAKTYDIIQNQKIEANTNQINKTQSGFSVIIDSIKQQIKNNADLVDNKNINQDADIESLRQINLEQDKQIAYATDIAETKAGMVSPWSGKVYLREVADRVYQNSNIWLGAKLSWETPVQLVEGLNNTKFKVSGEFAKIGGTVEDYSSLEIGISW